MGFLKMPSLLAVEEERKVQNSSGELTHSKLVLEISPPSTPDPIL